MAELESQLQLHEDSDLLIEILARLPVKSLIRFTCVCKYWLSLIRSPHFITKHYSTRSNLSEYDSIVSVFKPGCSISVISYQDLTFQTAFKFRPAVPFDPPRYEIYHRDVITRFFLVGPCNGLFLIELHKGFSEPYFVRMLWNPATRELFKLPEIPTGGCNGFGLGFDAVTNDYKVVGLYGYTDTGIHDNSIVWLYSLAANSWRRVFNAHKYLSRFLGCSTRVNNAGSSCNGRMHNWILNDEDDVFHWRGHFYARSRLLSFDMVDEVFVETPFPSDVPTPHGFLYQGSNCMYPTIFWIDDDLELHVWDLQQYGPTGVWNNVLNIKFPHGCLYMVLQKNKEEIVYSGLDTVSSFNLATQQVKSLQIPASDNILADNILAYTESLVSIARFVRQAPPTMEHSSDESVSLPLQLGDKGPVDDQQHLSETTMIHQMLPKEDDDSDDSSTDSAFLNPEISAFGDPCTLYGDDYETDLEFDPLRTNEVDRLSKLPYCLREINKPMISNPCTF